ncbi:uncharacterized protein LOC112506975 [Cynara cardunculus var. scolymus]|uniref:uncharacterized protein LOC112506975 n=1 Tax=Cynara cardunculus var. scolymus TaxID=59895 RepID=UPI000D631257|nr:uncharacterized protein LOC112506975 [Cynara cardunculus var. scolymus]
MTSHGRNYRVWSALEDVKLVESLVNMVNTGVYKADNGFKYGYLQHLKQTLKESIPNSGILGKPHIESRIKTMKEDWQVVYDMMHGSNTSGFGFDSEKYCVIVEPPVWEAYLQVHKEAEKWKNKTFPHFEDLCNVFGKNRANESRARDAMDMEDASMEDHINQFNNNLSDDQNDASHSHTNVQSQECASGSKKRKNMNDSLHEIPILLTDSFTLGIILRTKRPRLSLSIESQIVEKLGTVELDADKAMDMAHISKQIERMPKLLETP